jgi:AraC-like DNA-binding protein
MDVLSEILQTLRLSGAVFFSVRTADPFVAETPPMDKIGAAVMPEAEHVIPYHIMLRGSCWVEMLDGSAPPVRLDEGDVVIFPKGDGHVFLTEPGARQAPDIDRYRRPVDHPLPFVVALNDDGPWSVHFVCGYFGCAAEPFNPILESLPACVHSRQPPEGGHIEVDLIRAALQETDQGGAGSEAILARLSELLFVRVLRRFIAEMPETAVGLLAGLRDPNVSRALTCMHGQPCRDWTLVEIARESGLSRSAFSERFSACVGRSPMAYLQSWRMQVAATLLKETRRPLASIATEVGYASEAAFIRAFKTTLGIPPGAWRRQVGPAARRVG